MNATDRLHVLLDGLRGVYGLHTFAELFGFDWEYGSDWTWHDVACAMADCIEATLDESAERTCYDDAGCCSECGNRIGMVAYGDGIRTEPKYCPHCGSRIERRMRWENTAESSR